MENFIVSARKYRPVTFDTVVGQHAITTTLKNAIRNNQLAQAFLFCGPRGIGKTTCARILAKTINCENLSDDIEACNQCKSCLSFNTSASFNIHELDAASNNSVDDIRNLVDQVRIPPQIGKYKVYIIDEVHMLSQQAFNAFLKTLEEPPAYAKFILATTEKHKIIPTILSRCQIFDFKRIGVEDIANHLAYVAESEGVEAGTDALHIIAQKADGAMRDALSMFDQLVSFSGGKLTYEVVIDNLNVLDYDYYFKITQEILDGNISGVLLTVNEIIENGFDGQHFLNGLGEHLRNLLVCKDESTVRLLEISAGMRSQYLEQAGACSVNFILQSFEIINRFDINYKSSNNKRLHLEIAIMQLCSLSSEGRGRMLKEEIRKEALPPPENKKPEEKQNVVSEPASPVKSFKKEISKEKPSKSTTVGTGISIKEMSVPKKENDHKEPAPENTSKSDKPFTQEDLEEKWNKFATAISEKSPNLYYSLTKHKPLLGKDKLIEFTIENHVQEDEINARKSDLLGFLRKELNNDLIQLSTKVLANSSEAKPYTPMEKFRKMAEKNPAIARIKEQLDLDIDF